MASVELEQVEKVFPGGTRAVADLTLAIADGELLVVVGPSGCGKSTVLRMVAGLETPTRGQIKIGGERANERTPQERNVAMVFQDYALYPTMSVRGNLEFPLRMRGLERGEIERRVAWVAELLGMGEWLARRPAQLSGGQRQRTAMGRALVREPSVFLLDEPLSNLDARLRIEVREEIADLQRRTATTMLYVTHDQTEAMTLGQRVAVLHRGVLQQAAPPRELYERPANAFVAGFVGNPPMNLFDARLVRDDRGRTCAAFGDGALPVEPSDALARHVGESVTVGVRPEGLRPAAGNEPAVAALVHQVEYLGHETLVRARLLEGGQEGLAVRLPASSPVARGERLRLAADPEHIHLFASGGEALR